jgi:acyl-CoA hydrolase
MTIVHDIAMLDLSRYLCAGDRIVAGEACGEPVSLLRALIAQGRDIGGLSLFTAASFSGLLEPAVAESFALRSMGAIGSLRHASTAGVLEIVPCHFSRIGPMIDAGTIGCDVVFLQVSPPDANGNHSYGLVSDHVGEAVAKARVVIAEVNDQVPFTYADHLLPGERITCAVHVSQSPVEVAASPVGEVEACIARHVADLIADGTTIQIGIGAIPDAVLAALHDRKDLGVHTGLISDGIDDLIKAGVVTNARKPIDTGRSVGCALIGTRRLFDFAHHNRAFLMRSATYTHGQNQLAHLPRLVTVNSALEVDLTGQVNAEQSGDTYVGGTGGQVDFGRAGAASPGGHGVIALPSTAKGGTVSRIVPRLTGPVTTPRSDADVIVTEFGTAHLAGVSLSERCRRLVAIADPRFREDLERAARSIRRRGF